MSNSPAILARLSRSCSRGLHHHVHLMGGRAAGAAIYPPDLCLQILRGFQDQLRRDEALTVQDDEQLNFVQGIREVGARFGGVSGSLVPESIQ
eukprot:2269328-Heterocapsa_arctica.AAC.1